jgi:hypothetical protein
MPVCYGLVHIFRVGSVFATLSVTLERFFAIVFPFKVQLEVDTRVAIFFLIKYV